MLVLVFCICRKAINKYSNLQHRKRNSTKLEWFEQRPKYKWASAYEYYLTFIISRDKDYAVTDNAVEVFKNETTTIIKNEHVDKNTELQ